MFKVDFCNGFPLYGEIVSVWQQKDKERISYKLIVPLNSEAELIVSKSGYEVVSGLDAGLIKRSDKGGYVIASGEYDLQLSKCDKN